MRKLLTVGGAAVLAAALLVSGVPANAASASWSDPEGDATKVLGPETPRPSEPTYDVLGVDLNSDAKALRVSMKFKQLGDIPPYATGSSYYFFFVAGEGQFTASVINDRLGGEFMNFAVYDTTTQLNFQTECVKCTGKINVEKNVVEFVFPISALDSARRAAGVPGKIAPGTKIESVDAGGGEYYNGAYRVPGVTDITGGIVWVNNGADNAPLPAPGTFIL